VNATCSTGRLRVTIGLMDIITGNVGWIEVICGPMFSGKSEELIRRLRRAMIARKRVEVYKPRSITATPRTKSSPTATCA